MAPRLQTRRSRAIRSLTTGSVERRALKPRFAKCRICFALTAYGPAPDVSKAKLRRTLFELVLPKPFYRREILRSAQVVAPLALYQILGSQERIVPTKYAQRRGCDNGGEPVFGGFLLKAMLSPRKQ
jgi:hypothetical protein